MEDGIVGVDVLTSTVGRESIGWSQRRCRGVIVSRYKAVLFEQIWYNDRSMRRDVLVDLSDIVGWN